MTVTWLDTGVGHYRRAYAAEWVALVWPTEDGMWEWLVATFGAENGGGRCETEHEAKAAAAEVLCTVTKHTSGRRG